MPGDGLYPAVGLHSEGEEVRVSLDAEWEQKDIIHMSIDNCEEDWSRLHDVRLNGQVGWEARGLGYVLRFKSK